MPADARHSSAAPASLRIALLTPCFWPEVRRGTERFTRELADGLLARAQRPVVITSHPHALPSRRVDDRLPVVRLPRPPQRTLVRRGFLPYLTHVPLSLLALGPGRYDLAHAMYPSDAMAAAAWSRATGRPAILSYMGIPDRAGLTEHRGARAVTVRAVAGCEAVVALSHHAARAFGAQLGVRARVIPPGVNLSAFTPAQRRAPRPTFVSAAQPEVARKHIGLLVEALGVIRRRWSDARLLLSRPRDPAAARRAGVRLDAPGIEWLDLDDRAALARAYGEAWVAVLPSENEAFGLTLIEALACGTPVVGYDHGAIPEVLGDAPVGGLFARLDAGVLAAALMETAGLAEDPGTIERCRARAAEFSADRCADRYLALYNELS